MYTSNSDMRNATQRYPPKKTAITPKDMPSCQRLAVVRPTTKAVYTKLNGREVYFRAYSLKNFTISAGASFGYLCVPPWMNVTTGASFDDA